MTMMVVLLKFVIMVNIHKFVVMMEMLVQLIDECDKSEVCIHTTVDCNDYSEY